MMPRLKPNNTVIVSSVPFLFSEPRVDDIVLFKNSDKIMVKRISKILNGKYYVRGDNKVDSKNIEPISKREILGKVVITL
ncbi:MAG: hypothetical protein A2689_02755 [Candidatus Levybacteria bacterium RIFCSPHIGHO2_01_FULL_38_96]|nr:MAG: Signal peptidase I [Candidatus Levybacteria bacterium GW2011_GWA1_39_11]OGH15407.1 MAG: hypothetical protein A2689_02755 [Candidatus Levybacteria bacterium RIFCSPHIGHO2_01_FULL_38_96]